MKTNLKSKDTPGSLVIFVIYKKPKDYPDSYVVRRWYVLQGDDTMYAEISPTAVCKTRKQARAAIPGCCINIGLQYGLDPVIIERWMTQ